MSDIEFGFGRRKGGGGSSGGGALKNDPFIATAGQTTFVCTIPLNSNYTVFVNGALQSFGHTRVGNSVVFAVGLPEFTEVVVLN